MEHHHAVLDLGNLVEDLVDAPGVGVVDAEFRRGVFVPVEEYLERADALVDESINLLNVVVLMDDGVVGEIDVGVVLSRFLEEVHIREVRLTLEQEVHDRRDAAVDRSSGFGLEVVGQSLVVVLELVSGESPVDVRVDKSRNQEIPVGIDFALGVREVRFSPYRDDFTIRGCDATKSRAARRYHSCIVHPNVCSCHLRLPLDARGLNYRGVQPMRSTPTVFNS